MTDWQPYLTSICTHKEYKQWWKFYTATDATGEQDDDEQDDAPPLMNLGLTVETAVGEAEVTDEADADRRPDDKKPSKVERLDVLEGLRKYSIQQEGEEKHLLLAGQPGSGKSTALVRLLLEESQKCLDSADEPTVIPVLVELRYFRTSVMDLIRSFLKRHGVLLELADIERLLFDGHFLLLVDGVNELPSEEARRNVKVFRQNHPKTSMVFTTRNIGLGGDLAIGRRLEMQRLSEQQMRQFVCQYLPGQGEQMWRQMGERLKRLGETPLFLWMICSVFAEKKSVLPQNLGLVFESFTAQYDSKIKEDVAISSSHRVLWPKLLQCLAFEMIHGNTPTKILVTIAEERANSIIETCLIEWGIVHDTRSSQELLTELVNHHLIQKREDKRIEFRHQLIQEYYAAKKLHEQINTSRVSTRTLKKEYINYLKWTEPLKLMIELMSEKSPEQALSLIQRNYSGLILCVD